MSTMENLDVNRDTDGIHDSGQGILTESTPIQENCGEIAEFRKYSENQQDSGSNDQFLKRKRDADSNCAVLECDNRGLKLTNPEGNYLIIKFKIHFF